jgi:hypothetical protein
LSRKAIRKQHVSLRFKRREQLKHQLRVFGVRGVALALIVGFGGGLVAGRDSYASLFIQHHAPLVDLNMPQVLAGLPIQAGLPKNTFWLWCPGSGLWLQRQICQRYPSVRAVRLERHFDMNRLMVHVEPRIPLVTWNGFGFDKEGVLFPVVPRAWNALPQAALPASVNKHDLSLWLVRLASVTDLWPQVTSVREDLSETMALTLKTGTVVIWGTLETEPTLYKAQALLRVLDDAHQNLGGASRADLRFFEQGRIIVLPKGK